jgi:hypothetical protein
MRPSRKTINTVSLHGVTYKQSLGSVFLESDETIFHSIEFKQGFAGLINKRGISGHSQHLNILFWSHEMLQNWGRQA